MYKIPLAKPYYCTEDVEAVKKVFESGWVAQGPTTERFEVEVSKFCGAKHGVALNSCTSALHLALLAHGLGKRDKVLVPDFTFPATGNAVLYTGAKPVIVDIDLNTFCVDPRHIEEKIDERVKAIVPVHAFGHPADIDELSRLARKYDLCVIEDAACALGSEFGGVRIGSFGYTTCFSFHARKLISTGEGGMVVVDDEKVAEDVRALRSHGMSLEAHRRDQISIVLPTFKILGYNYRMSDISAAIGLAQLKKIEGFIEKRISLARYYDDAVEDAKLDLRTPEIYGNVRHVYQSYVILLGREGIRDKVIRRLRTKGIGCTIGTYSLSLLPLFRKYKGNCPCGNYAFENTIALPMFQELKEEEIAFVVKTLKGILRAL